MAHGIIPAMVTYDELSQESIVTTSQEDIQQLNEKWESIRSQALPVGMSLDLIKRTVEERWT
jgi:hypothetical protein